MANLNQIPNWTENLEDISWIEERYLEGKAKFYWQTLVFQKFWTSEISSLIASSSFNLQGRIIVNWEWNENILLTENSKAVCKWITTDDLMLSEDQWFNYFTTRLWPKFNETLLYHTIVFVSSYFDFIKLKHFFKQQNSSFSYIHEHLEDIDCLKEWNKFEYEKNRFLLVSEWSLVFSKVDLWYAKNIIFYSLPESTDITK